MNDSDETPNVEPSSPQTPMTRTRKRMSMSSPFVSPVNLPVRPTGSMGTGSRHKKSISQVSQISPSGLSIASPASYKTKAVPVSGDENIETIPAPRTTEELDLIFNDNDERLPPPEPSPRRKPKLEADIVAISSPSLSPGIAGQLEEVDLDDVDTLELFHEENIHRAPSPAMWPSLPSVYNSSVDPTAAANGVFYPAPIPAQLLRPPRLSKKPRPRKSSFPVEKLPPAPQWGVSPLEPEVEYTYPGHVDESFESPPFDEREISDVDSDRATIMSDDRDEFEDAPDPDDDKSADAKGADSNRSPGWLSKVFGRNKYKELGETKDELGEKYDSTEIPRDDTTKHDDLAFSRLDPEAIQRHSQMFDAGGIYSSIVPRSGGTTSLIEELEVRKAGKKVQHQVFLREVAEMERQRMEDAQEHKNYHPADLVYAEQPTLLQMKYMADKDYESRVNWHKKAINQNYKQNSATETLAERRKRIREKKLERSQNILPAQETLAERRQRLKMQRSKLNIQGNTNNGAPTEVSL